MVPKAFRSRTISDEMVADILTTIGHAVHSMKDSLDLLTVWADQSEDWDVQDHRMACVASLAETLEFDPWDLTFALGRLRAMLG